MHLETHKERNIANRCKTATLLKLHVARPLKTPPLELVLTIIHAKNDGSPKESSNCLKEEIHGELSPALSPKQAEGKGHCRIQMAACNEDERMSINTGYCLKFFQNIIIITVLDCVFTFLLLQVVFWQRNPLSIPDTWPHTRMPKVAPKPNAKLTVMKRPWLPSLSTCCAQAPQPNIWKTKQMGLVK